ncbi:hypothetical protein [Geomicrobium sp. JCM 19038]|uniref:hypothetical protein n=1 Tax=Geomicrobium sp. JCM 19038 TaxID=1460635 RepID=UPI00045F1FF9|nr:hypothetical protein [Geomicrobium sp. JCM 19038]GAK07230.1 hypothetical protein JCM19038_952 [Geomicrobium sp. JCM 19038]
MEIGVESQVKFLERLTEYLETVTDGLQLVTQFYHQGETEPADRLREELIQGFERFGDENVTMYAIFRSDEQAYEEWRKLLEEVKQPFDSLSVKGKQERIATVTLPAFQRFLLTSQRLLREKK